jgi:hypothetical protein
VGQDERRVSWAWWTGILFRQSSLLPWENGALRWLAAVSPKSIEVPSEKQSIMVRWIARHTNLAGFSANAYGVLRDAQNPGASRILTYSFCFVMALLLHLH